MSGPRRLAVFLSLLWVGYVTLNSMRRDDTFDLERFLMAGIFPVAFLWGVSWVVAGFRGSKRVS